MTKITGIQRCGPHSLVTYVESLWRVRQHAWGNVWTWLVRADTATEAIAFVVAQGVPVEQLEIIGSWGLNLSDDGVVFSFMERNGGSYV